jgi:hypothetical protein
VNSLPLRPADEVPLDSASGNCPKPGPQVRQDYGLGAHDDEGDPSREINIFSSLVTVRAPYGSCCSFPFLLHRDHRRGLTTGVRRKAGKPRQEVNRDALLPYAHDHPLRFLISGDDL